jgi:hypothetical protein
LHARLAPIGCGATPRAHLLRQLLHERLADEARPNQADAHTLHGGPRVDCEWRGNAALLGRRDEREAGAARCGHGPETEVEARDVQKSRAALELLPAVW